MKKIVFLILSLWLAGCSSIIENQTAGLANSLADAILNSDDPETVRQGAPSFLLMLDGLLNNSPDSEAMLRASAQLNAAYAGVFVDEPARQKRMLDKALNHAAYSMCLQDDVMCDIRSMNMDSFLAAYEAPDEDSIDTQYVMATTWVSWIQANSDDWLAISHLPKIEHMLKAIVAYQEDYKDGGSYLYLGGLSTLIPASLGGKPEQGKTYFEKAHSLSDGRNLMAGVLLAEKYARLVFDQSLHDRVLREVLDADPVYPGYTLTNVLAQERAKELLDESSDYF